MMRYNIEKKNRLIIYGATKEEALQELVNITKNIQETIVSHPEYSVDRQTIQLIFEIAGKRLKEHKFFKNLPYQKELTTHIEQFIKQLIQYNNDHQTIYTHEELETGTSAIEYLVTADLANLPLYIEFLNSIDLEHTVEQLAVVDRLAKIYNEEQLHTLLEFLRKDGGELFKDWFRFREPKEQSTLHKAVREKKIESVKKLLEQKNINLHELDAMNGYSPLHYSKGSIDIAKLLIEAGTDINCQNTKGETVLHSCLEEDGYYNAEFIKYILDAGANIKLKDKKGRSAIHHVQTIDGLNLILKYGGKLSDQDNEDETLLHVLAPWNFETELFIEIVKHGGDPNAINKEGRNPLFLAVMSGNAELAEVLYESGADPDLKDKNGKSARDLVNHTFFNDK